MKLHKIPLVLFFSLFFTAFPAFSFELFQFEVAPEYSLLNGQINEHLYYTNSSKQISELNWDLKNLNCIGVNANVTWEFLTLDSKLMWGIPARSGTMYDSDWMDPNYGGTDYSMKTNYSESQNNVDSYFDTNIRLLVNIKPVSFLNLRPYLGISYNETKFSANGGTYWYGDKNSTGKTYNVSYNSSEAVTDSLDSYGEVIAYEIQQLNYLLGTQVDFSFLNRFKISLDLDTALYTSIYAKDRHFVSQADSLDKIQGFFCRFDFGAILQIDIWKGLSAGLSGYYHLLNLMKGPEYGKNVSESKYSKTSQNGGFSANYWNFDFFVKYSF